ncbi:MAG: PQQ-binding-like beta-propeller repeat protein [Pirellula sp.]
MNRWKNLNCTEILIATATLVILCVMQPLQAEDWGQFGGPNRNFRITDRKPDGDAVRTWQVAVDGGDDAPIVIGDRIVYTQMDVAEDGTDAHRMVCRNVEDGSLLWQRSFAETSYLSQDINDRYPVRPLASACASGDRIVAIGFGGSVRCVRLNDGALLWSHDLVKEYGAKPVQYGSSTAPWCNEEVAVVACGGDEALLIAFRLSDGSLAWKAGKGPASYASLIEFSVSEDASAGKQLVYAAGDQLLAVEARSGAVLWEWAYPKSGLTNAVTPIAIGPGQLLVAGQGIGGSVLLQIEQPANGSPSIREVWRNDKINPFYCNWLHVPGRNLVVGFAGKTLYGLDVREGKTLWQKRGWTDANAIMVNEDVYLVRGDGVLAQVDVDANGVRILKATSIANDRVWAPMAVHRGRYLIRGRTGLYSGDLDAIPSADALPEGTGVTSMDAMYGQPNERIAALVASAKGDPMPLTWEQYEAVANDASLQMVASTWNGVLNALAEREQWELSKRIAEDWVRRAPQSLEGWERWVEILERLGDQEQVRTQAQDRMVEVVFDFEVPANTPQDAQVLVYGNAASLGKWRGTAFPLSRVPSGRYQGNVLIPKGDLQFKLALGSMDRVEVRVDGRQVSNRRVRIKEATTLRGAVQNWKEAPKKETP